MRSTSISNLANYSLSSGGGGGCGVGGVTTIANTKPFGQACSSSASSSTATASSKANI